MKPHVLLALAAIIGLTVLVATETFSQQEGQEGGQEVDMDAYMKKFMAVATPGPEHAFLKKFAGSWEAETEMWTGGPGTPTQKGKGSSEWTMIFGGRYVQTRYKGSMMGQPFDGIGIMGYDRFRKTYTQFWIDSMSTAMSTAEGTRAPKSNRIDMYGSLDDPGFDMVGKATRYSWEVVGDDKIVFAMYDLAAGPNYKVIQITYTRKK